MLTSLSFAHPHVGAAERDALAIPPSELVGKLRRLRRRPPELVVISTCLRHELVAVGAGFAELQAVAAELSGLETLPAGEYRHGREAATHLFRVAAGLRSPVVGELEVLGQVRRAHRAAHEAGTIGPMLDQLLREGVRTARESHEVLPEVDHGSIAAIAADHLLDREPGRLLLIGAGAMSNAVFDHLGDSPWQVVRITRRPERVGPGTLGFDALEDELAAADVAVCAVTSPKPLIGAGLLQAVSGRRSTPLTLVDLGMPANVERAEVANVELVGIDDLARDDRHRLNTDEAEALIEIRALEVHARIVNSTLTPLIQALREKAETATREELERAYGRLRDLSDEQRGVIEQMARTLTNRLLHDPLTYLSKHPEAVATSHTAREILGIEA